jgi:hypothetical protein
MRLRPLLVAAALLVAMPLAAPPAAAAPGAAVRALPGEAAVRQAKRLAQQGLFMHDRLVYSLEKAATPADRAAILEQLEGATHDALADAFAQVKDATRTSPAGVVTIYQVAKDALESNRSGRIEERIAYNVGALRKIVVAR